MHLSWSLVLEKHCKLLSASPKCIFSLSSTTFPMAEWFEFVYLQILGVFFRFKRSLIWKFLYWLNSGSGEVGKHWKLLFVSCCPGMCLYGFHHVKMMFCCLIRLRRERSLLLSPGEGIFLMDVYQRHAYLTYRRSFCLQNFCQESKYVQAPRNCLVKLNCM